LKNLFKSIETIDLDTTRRFLTAPVDTCRKGVGQPKKVSAGVSAPRRGPVPGRQEMIQALLS